MQPLILSNDGESGPAGWGNVPTIGGDTATSIPPTPTTPSATQDVQSSNAATLSAAQTSFLPPAPVASPMLNANGYMTNPWVSWFQLLARRVGGNVSSVGDQSALFADDQQVPQGQAADAILAGMLDLIPDQNAPSMPNVWALDAEPIPQLVDGSMFLLTDEPVGSHVALWNDINVSLVPPQGGAAAPAIIPFNGDARLDCYAFSGTNATPDEIHSSLEILHGYKEGSDISFHLHWYPTNTTVGNVKWQLRYTWFNNGTVPGAATTVFSTVATSGTAWLEQNTAITISGAGMKMGSRFVFSLFRDATDAADTYAFRAAVTDMGIHYEIDAVGSRSVALK